MFSDECFEASLLDDSNSYKSARVDGYCDLFRSGMITHGFNIFKVYIVCGGQNMYISISRKIRGFLFLSPQIQY